MKRLIAIIVAIGVALGIMTIATPAQAASIPMKSRTIYVQNMNAGSWPYAQAVWKWNDSAAINMYNWGPCKTGATCIRIYAYYSNDGRHGYSRWWYVSGRITHGEIHLNRRHAGSTNQQIATACHELGHVIGLEHNWSYGCMQPRSGAPRNPSATDYQTLINRYRGVPW